MWVSTDHLAAVYAVHTGMSSAAPWPTFQTVLVGVDGRGGGRDAIALARRFAADGARIVFVGVFRPPAMGRAGALWQSVQSTYAQQQLERECRAGDALAETIACCDRSPGRALQSIAQREDADLVVIGAGQRGPVARLLSGGGTFAGLRGAACAVAVAPAGFAVAADPSELVTVDGGCGPWPAVAERAGSTVVADDPQRAVVRPLLVRPARVAVATA